VWNELACSSIMPGRLSNQMCILRVGETSVWEWQRPLYACACTILVFVISMLRVGNPQVRTRTLLNRCRLHETKKHTRCYLVTM